MLLNDPERPLKLSVMAHNHVLKSHLNVLRLKKTLKNRFECVRSLGTL